MSGSYGSFEKSDSEYDTNSDTSSLLGSKGDPVDPYRDLQLRKAATNLERIAIVTTYTLVITLFVSCFVWMLPDKNLSIYIPFISLMLGIISVLWIIYDCFVLILVGVGLDNHDNKSLTSSESDYRLLLFGLTLFKIYMEILITILLLFIFFILLLCALYHLFYYSLTLIPLYLLFASKPCLFLITRSYGTFIALSCTFLTLTLILLNISWSYPTIELSNWLIFAPIIALFTMWWFILLYIIYLSYLTTGTSQIQLQRYQRKALPFYLIAFSLAVVIIVLFIYVSDTMMQHPTQLLYLLLMIICCIIFAAIGIMIELHAYVSSPTHHRYGGSQPLPLRNEEGCWMVDNQRKPRNYVLLGNLYPPPDRMMQRKPVPDVGEDGDEDSSVKQVFLNCCAYSFEMIHWQRRKQAAATSSSSQPPQRQPVAQRQGSVARNPLIQQQRHQQQVKPGDIKKVAAKNKQNAAQCDDEEDSSGIWSIPSGSSHHQSQSSSTRNAASDQQQLGVDEEEDNDSQEHPRGGRRGSRSRKRNDSWSTVGSRSTITTTATLKDTAYVDI